MSNNVKMYQKDLLKATNEFLVVLDLANTRMAVEVEQEKAFYQAEGDPEAMTRRCTLGLKGTNLLDLQNLLVKISNELSQSDGPDSDTMDDYLQELTLKFMSNDKNTQLFYSLGSVGSQAGVPYKQYPIESIDVKTSSSTFWERFNVAVVLAVRSFFRLFDTMQSFVTKNKMNDTRQTSGAREVRKFLNLAESSQFFPRPVLSIQAAKEEFSIALKNLNDASFLQEKLSSNALGV